MHLGNRIAWAALFFLTACGRGLAPAGGQDLWSLYETFLTLNGSGFEGRGIRGGARSGDPTIGLLTHVEEDGRARGVCTLTLLNSRIGVTARHCVAEHITGANCADPGCTYSIHENGDFQVSFEARPGPQSVRIRSQRVAVPNPHREPGTVNDYALVRLAEPVLGLTAFHPLMPNTRRFPLPAIGTEVIISGFGNFSDQNRNPGRLAGTALLTGFRRAAVFDGERDDAFLELSPGPTGQIGCPGDSGAVALAPIPEGSLGQARLAIVGVLSQGVNDRRPDEAPTCDRTRLNLFTNTRHFNLMARDALSRL